MFKCYEMNWYFDYPSIENCPLSVPSAMHLGEQGVWVPGHCFCSRAGAVSSECSQRPDRVHRQPGPGSAACRCKVWTQDCIGDLSDLLI